MLPTKKTEALFEGSHGTAPDLIYARGVPYTPDPGLITFDKKLCTLIVTVMPHITGEYSSIVEAICSVVCITIVLESI